MIMGNEKGIVNMKNHYKDMPESLKGTYGDFSRNFGFSWKEFVATVMVFMLSLPA